MLNNSVIWYKFSGYKVDIGSKASESNEVLV